MGSSNSTQIWTNTIIQSPSFQISHCKLLDCEAKVKELIDRNIEEMKLEAASIEPAITYLVESSIEQDGCAITEYENAQDISKVKIYLESTFGNTVEAKAAIYLATVALEPMKDREALKEMLHWQQLQTMRTTNNSNGVPDKLLGIELHYKLAVIDEAVLESILRKYIQTPDDTRVTKTLVMAAYKMVAHTMQQDALDSYLTREQKQL